MILVNYRLDPQGPRALLDPQGQELKARVGLDPRSLDLGARTSVSGMLKYFSQRQPASLSTVVWGEGAEVAWW